MAWHQSMGAEPQQNLSESHRWVHRFRLHWFLAESAYTPIRARRSLRAPQKPPRVTSFHEFRGTNGWALVTMLAAGSLIASLRRGGLRAKHPRSAQAQGPGSHGNRRCSSRTSHRGPRTSRLEAQLGKKIECNSTGLL